jgi:hypothetical protein
MGLKIWSLSNLGSNQRPFDHWLTSLLTALTEPTTELVQESQQSIQKLSTAFQQYSKLRYTYNLLNFRDYFLAAAVQTRGELPAPQKKVVAAVSSKVLGLNSVYTRDKTWSRPICTNVQNVLVSQCVTIHIMNVISLRQWSHRHNKKERIAETFCSVN